MLEYQPPKKPKKGEIVVSFVGGPADGCTAPVRKLTATIMADPPKPGYDADTPGMCYLRREQTTTYDYIGFVSLNQAKEKYLERIEKLEAEDPADWWKNGPQDEEQDGA